MNLKEKIFITILASSIILIILDFKCEGKASIQTKNYKPEFNAEIKVTIDLNINQFTRVNAKGPAT